MLSLSIFMLFSSISIAEEVYKIQFDCLESLQGLLVKSDFNTNGNGSQDKDDAVKKSYLLFKSKNIANPETTKTLNAYVAKVFDWLRWRFKQKIKKYQEGFLEKPDPTNYIKAIQVCSLIKDEKFQETYKYIKKYFDELQIPDIPSDIHPKDQGV